jgi:RNA polymerase sigma factor (sigma-70 family)
MKDEASLTLMAQQQNQQITDLVQREGSRLQAFIRQRVANARDAEDILQDVFYRLVEANRLLMPIDHLTGWLFQVARNLIIDGFRKQQPESFSDAGEEGGLLLDELLPAPDDGPAAAYTRKLLIAELELAIAELPEEQRRVFIAHELEGRSFRELAAESGININTLLSRKRYAVLNLRHRLQQIYDEFNQT